MAVAAPLGGERRRLALEDPPQLEEVVHVRVLVEREDEAEGALERVRSVGDDEGPAVRRRDHALRLEHPQRLADGGAADVEALRQLSFGRQGVARLQPARADLAEQLLGDLDVHLATLDGLVARGWLHSGTVAGPTSRRVVAAPYGVPQAKASGRRSACADSPDLFDSRPV